MKKFIHVFGYLFFGIGYFFHSAAVPTQAWVKVPVCELVGEPLKSDATNNSVFIYYNNLPLCGQRIKDCRRIHQLLFNEMVMILEVKGDECLVKVPSIFYERDDSSGRFDTYWSLKKNFITREDLEKNGNSYDYFPESLAYQKKSDVFNKRKIITLMLPFYEPKTKQHYSAGTRFVMVCSKGNCFGNTVYLFDQVSDQCITAVIPHNLCRIENSNEPFQKKIHDFVVLLRRWTKQNGFIPYVWGGSSCVNFCKKDEFFMTNDKATCSYYRSECELSPKTGFDCAGLIARAAQICGLPYYFKNSLTIKKNLEAITDKDKIREGDIIWIPGHVMVVASLIKWHYY